MELTSLIDQYGELKAKSNKLYSEYKNGLEEVERLRWLLQKELEKTGLKSAKSGEYAVTTVTKPNIFVQNEHSVLLWLKDAPNIESDAYIGLKTTSFKKLALQMLKETGELVPGTDAVVTESISIKANKK